MGARQNMLDLVVASGWNLDTEARRLADRYTRESVQDPHVFLKPAAHGGTWRISLNYANGQSYHRAYDNRLREVVVEHIGAVQPDGTTRRSRIGRLFRPGKYDGFNGLWRALGLHSGDSIVARADRLVRNPDLAVWLAREAEYAYRVLQNDQYAKEREERNAKAQPLAYVALGDGSHSYGSPWRALASRLAHTADHLRDADGTDDVPVQIVEAFDALSDLMLALTDEGRVRLTAEFAKRLETEEEESDEHQPDEAVTV